MARQIDNPVLRGFNPDPSFLRVGQDYYIATSTFEWWPGVAIHHSKDLVNWRLLTHALTRQSQLDMTGNPNSGGIWAPCLSYADGIFYLIYTDVKSRRGAFKDTHNYLVTASSIEGPWSDPVYLNSSGFDPSLYHGHDDRKWLLNMVWDHRQGRNRFGGIVLQEYSVAERRLVGRPETIFLGTNRGFTEGPHLYYHDGFYHLMVAEGGTKYDHCVTMARARDITGPYEVDPLGSMLTSADDRSLPLQKSGHGSLIETHTGEWYLAHLCARPVVDHYCILGRETALQRCSWSADGWLRLAQGENKPLVEVAPPALPAVPFDPVPDTVFFATKVLGQHWSTLRSPPDPSWMTFDERDGFLRLYGRESLSSMHRQSLVARRQQAFDFEAEIGVDFAPENFQQMAGLVLFYDTDDYVYLRITSDEKAGKILGIVRSVAGAYEELPESDVVLTARSLCRLKAEVTGPTLKFSYALGDSEWTRIGPQLDIRNLSDDFAEPVRFTGNFIGMCVQDLAGTRAHADFEYFSYRELNHSSE